MRLESLVGKKFGLYTILSISDIRASNGGRRYICKCICGKVWAVSQGNLTNTKSCGCWRRERFSRLLTTHNKSKDKNYSRWFGMLDRCLNPNNKSYKNYGGRGIKVCKRWMKIQNFIDDMGDCPPGKSIDRINNNGNYNLKNCRWATPKEQANNQRPRSFSLLKSKSKKSSLQTLSPNKKESK